MHCPRCAGLMVERPCWERDWRTVSSRWSSPLYLWSCVNCGNCVDRTILFNQQHPVEPRKDRFRKVWHTIKQMCKEVAA